MISEILFLLRVSFCMSLVGDVPVIKGNKKVNRKSKLDADKGNDYTTHVTIRVSPFRAN